jgi:glycosyltransferase involved in cell wall biosynthesis
MSILFLGTYDVGKPRTRILRDGIRAAGASLVECHAAVWDGIEDKSQVRGIARRARLVLRWLARYPALAWRFARAARPDVVLIGYPGVLDMLLLAPLARLRGVPVAWDMFMSLYDTVVHDRKLLRPQGLAARLLWIVERQAIRLADAVFLDTEAHARRVEHLFGLRPGACGRVWVGAEVEVFEDAAVTKSRAVDDDRHKVLFYGQFIPLHGIETIVAAANLLRDEPFEWTIIGRGQDEGRIRCLLQDQPLPRLRWLEWVEYAELREWIQRSDICLGIFGTSEKAASVIPNKVFQTVVSGRALITRDSPAIRELLSPQPPCVYLVPPGDPGALAGALRQHRVDCAAAAGRLPECHVGIIRRVDQRAVGNQFLEVIGALGNRTVVC